MPFAPLRSPCPIPRFNPHPASRPGATVDDTTERTSFGTPAFFVKTKLFGRLREDGELFVLRTGFFERDALISSAPDIYSTTPHYKDHPSVLVRLATVDPDEFRELLIESWRFIAPKRLLATFDAARNQPVA